MAGELVFTGGRAFCADAAGSFVDAVAVGGSRVIAVGDAAVSMVGPGTEVHDLAGGLLVPGFVDAHAHPVQGGLERMRCDLTAVADVTGAQPYLDAIAAYSRANPHLPWILGGGWQMAAFPGGTPTAAMLDSVVADRPVLLPNRDHHGAWANTAALELAGVDASTPDPADGRIERDASGAPTGTLHEGAMDLVSRFVPADTQDDHVAGLLAAQAYLHSLGITGWQDAIIGDYANITDASAAYVRAIGAGQLTMRVVGALWWQRGRGTEQVAELVAKRDALVAQGFQATSVKIMQDGIAENGTAGMLEPYLDGHGCATHNAGLSFVDPVALRTHVTELDAACFQVHVHAIGDRAVREALDAFEAARRANGLNDLRHHIAHIQVIHPDDVPRFADLKVAANMQALWAVHEPQMDELTIPFLGEPRVSWQYPFADLERTGAMLAAGSDWPVSSPDPLAAIHVAVNRTPPDEVGVPPLLPGQRLDLTTALRAYTAGSAYLNHADDTGKIAVGAVADLAVLDRDPFAGPAEEIGQTRVVATYVAGRRVYPTT
ncbi:MAG: amidohydrolase [Nocardioidaceae bacterium]